MNKENSGNSDGCLGPVLHLARLSGAPLALAMMSLAATACDRGDSSRTADSGGGLTATITIEPFRSVAPTPKAWAPEVFAESLATRLAVVQGLSVTRGGLGPATDYALGGDVTSRGGRLVMSTRLSRAGEPKVVWTATFWRNDGPNRNLVQDVAADVVEAVYADVARRALTTKERQ